MKTGFGRNRLRHDWFWAKPTDFIHREQCDWCFKNAGQPEDIFTGNMGQWAIDRKHGIFYFRDRDIRNQFSEAWT